MKKTLFVAIFILLLVLPPLILLVNYPYADVYLFINLCALMGLTLMSFQFILSGRWPILERSFGQDRLLLAHRVTGMSAVLLLLGHGVLVLIDSAAAGGIQFQLAYDYPRLMGIAGLVILLFLGVGSGFRQKLGIPYDSWKNFHRITYILYPVLFLHALLLGSVVASSLYVYIQFLLMFALVLVTWVWRLSLVIRARKHPYLLSAVDKLNHSVHQFSFAGPPLMHRPGQFAYLTVVHKGKRLPSHPFTISSSPLQKDIVFSIKASGDFTSELPALPPGSSAFIEGPYGRFSHTNFNGDARLLFIAGGVGITPMLSMLRILRTDDPDRHILLLWGNRTAADVFLLEELKDIQRSMKNFRMVHIFSELQSDVEGLGEHSFGFIDSQVISEYAGQPGSDEVFLCGPPAMIKLVKPELRTLGYKSRRLHVERFGL